MLEGKLLYVIFTLSYIIWKGRAIQSSKYRRAPALADSRFLIRLSEDQLVTYKEVRMAKKKGPNMCVERKPNANVDTGYFCDIFMGRYQCRRKRQLFHTVYYCCPGYQTAPGKKGCPLEKHWDDRNALKALKQLGLSVFLDLTRRTYLQRFVKEQRSITLLIPSNEAWKKWKQSKKGQIIWNNEYILRLIIMNHIVGGKWPSVFLKDHDRLETIRPTKFRELRVKFFKGKKIMMIEGAVVIKKDISASNAVIHIIDRIIQPPKKTVARLLSEMPELRQYNLAFRSLSYNFTDRTTVLAPMNSAFRKISKEARGRLATRMNCLKELIFIHIIENVIYFPVLRLMRPSSIKTVQGSRLLLRMRNGVVYVNGEAVETKFVGATDGVIYIINKLLTPTTALTMMDVLQSLKNTKSMTQLVNKHGLDKTFNRANANVTLFIPYDATFFSSPFLWEHLLINRTSGMEFLYYHMTPGRVLTVQLRNEQLLPSYLGKKKLRVNFFRRQMKLAIQGSCMDFRKRDIKTCNGVIHLLSWKYLTPPMNTIFQIVSNHPRLTVLKSAIEMTGMVGLLSSNTPFTLFAPVDEAWRKLKGFKLFELFEDDERLTDLVRYHILPGTLYYCGLGIRNHYRSINGRGVRINIYKRGFIDFNYARSIEIDIGATNGVVHVVNSLVMYLSKEVLIGHSYG